MRYVLLVCLFGMGVTAAEPDVTVRPAAKPGPLDNPLKGWCPYPNAGVIRQPYSMVFQYVPWRTLEPVEGDFRFADWEKTWDVGAAVGKHIIFRVYIDYPKSPSGLPDWLREAGVKETAYTDHGGGRSPDYDDARMIAAMERLIAALGKRYDNHPRVAFVELGLLGFWGEWHTFPRTKLYASTDTEKRVVDAYRRAFPNKSLMVRYARGHAGRQDWIGFHDDMFPKDTDNGQDWSFLAGLRATKRTENWRTAVVGGEMEPGQAAHWLGDGYDTTRAAVEKTHFSWVGPYGPASAKPDSEQFTRRCEELVRRMGYEYRITEVVHPTTLTAKRPGRVTLKAENTGVAPFYYPWAVEWALLDTAGKPVSIAATKWDVRKWLPGPFAETGAVTFDAPPGTYRLALGVRDPWPDRPAVRFANDLPVVEGWTVVSTVTVAK